MTTDDVLVLAGMLLAHLVSDFVLQTDRVASDKAASGRRAWRGALLHAAGVALCLVPIGVLFWPGGAAALVAITVAHVVIDRWKVAATRRAEARALAAAHARHARPGEDPTGLGPAWTPLPAALFAFDQLLHAVVIVAAWTVWVAGTTPVPGAADLIDGVLGGTDRALVHQVALGAVVVTALAIVNVRAGALFVATLVRPREVVTGAPLPDEAAPERATSRTRWRLRVGPIVAMAEPIRPAEEEAKREISGQAASASPARVGATIGILERLLIVTFVLTNATAAIGFVVAAKTLARFKQLDDRDFAEYYLLGTLASVAVALGSALVAAAALRTAGL